MKKIIESLGTQQYKSGELVKISKDGKVNLPISNNEEQTMLFVSTKEGYRLIPFVPDAKRVYIEVTTKCNFACITCIRSSWKDSLEHMAWETFESIRENLKELPELETVHFGGFGEPMMHPRIFDMVKDIKNLGLKVEMITNGSYLTDENIRKLIDIELDVLFTSFDSPDEERYNEIRIGADFKNVSRNIENMQEFKRKLGVTKPELAIEFVAMKKNFQQLPELIKMAHNLKVNQIIVSNLIPYDESMKDEIVYDLDESSTEFSKEAMKTTIWAQVSNMKLRTERSCKFMNDKSLCINFEGNVSPCYALMHEYDSYIYGQKKHMHPCYVGNVNHKSLKEIWTDSGYINFRRVVRDNLYPSCIDCKYRDGCSYRESNEMDCWGNSPSCGECLWSRGIIACP